MSTHDSAVGLPLPIPPPTPTHSSRVWSVPPAHRPGGMLRGDPARVMIDDYTMVIRHWTAEEWGRMPVAMRPHGTIAGEFGGRYQLLLMP